MYPGGMMLNVQSPFGLPPLPDETIQELRDMRAEGKHADHVCGKCGAGEGKDGAALLSCGKCKKRKYCGKECQKKHWALHKKVCKVPAGGKEHQMA